MPSGVRDSKHVREHSIDATPLEGRRIIISTKALHFQIVLASLFIAAHKQLTRITTRLTLPVNQNPNALRPNYKKIRTVVRLKRPRRAQANQSTVYQQGRPPFLFTS